MGQQRKSTESNISWLSFDPSELEAARRVIESLGSNNTVDVLGLGHLMENISDFLFPATSTLHTRARYLIFVSSIFANMYRFPRSDRPEREIFQNEYAIQKALVSGGEREGVIGRTREDALKYWPSMTYWNAINKLKLFGNVSRSKEDFFKAISNRYEDVQHDSDELVANEGHLTIPEALFFISNGIYLDPKRGKVRPSLSFVLTKAEAKFLKEQYELTFEDSLMTHLLHQPKTYVRNLETPFLSRDTSGILKERLREAHLYSVFSAGAYTAYRWALCHFRSQKSQAQEWSLFRDKNLAHFTHWHKRDSKLLRDWSVSNVFDTFDLPSDNKLIEFQEMFSKAIRAGDLLKCLRQLAPVLAKREFSQKHNRSHFEDVTVVVPENVKGENPVRPYDYRFDIGRGYVLDILEGLSR